MEFQEFIAKIKQLHHEYEQLSGNLVYLQILKHGGPRIEIGDFAKREKYVVCDMIIYKELEGTYSSIHSFDKKVAQFREQKKIDRDIYMCPDEGTVCVGRGFRTEIGKVIVSN